VANWADTTLSVLLGNGDGTFRKAVPYSVGDNPHGVTVADVNGDGIPDLVASNFGSNNVSVLLGKGDGTFRPAINYAVGSQPLSVVVADFNGDGKPDLAVANGGTNSTTDPGSVSILLGNGNGTFQAAVNYSAGEAPGTVAVGDFNRDGHVDLVVTNYGDLHDSLASGTLSVLLGNGDGTFQAAQTYAGAYGISVAVKDLNGDGIADLAVTFGGGVRVLLGNGDGTFQTTSISYVAGGPWGMAAGDLNGDGLPDLAVANTSANSGVTILINDGKWGP
jgi:hypothetical protein